MNILALNAGSTSLKFRFGPAEGRSLHTGAAQGFGTPTAKLQITDASKTVVYVSVPDTLQGAARSVLEFFHAGKPPVAAIGHRFVHGGPALRAHRRIDSDVRAQLQEASAFAPLHNPPALEVLALAEELFPGTFQVACLDTAFHATMPETSTRLPLPRERLAGGLMRYGFHGLSCESIVRQLGNPPSRLVIAHLGGGASVTAVHDGCSIDTTMGLTPDGGVMMETRSGDLDPGLLLYLLRHGETPESLEKMLNNASGIAGVSGGSGDPRELANNAKADATLALDMFTISIAKAIAGMAAVLGGMDMLVFTGGIGEHDVKIRTSITAHLGFIGGYITKVMGADEELEIIQHTAKLLR